MSISMATKLEQICQAKRNQISPLEMARRLGMKPQTVWSWFSEGDDSMDSSWPQMSKRTTYNYVQRYRVGVWGPKL
jgi:transposase-like protein